LLDNVVGGVGRRALEQEAQILSLRRSSSDMPPHTTASWPFGGAHCRDMSIPGQRRHIGFAFTICRSAGPEFATGKNSSPSSSTDTSWNRQRMALTVTARPFPVGMTAPCL
jgi:hypothetical protein